jgi:hypothetical protein
LGVPFFLDLVWIFLRNSSLSPSIEAIKALDLGGLSIEEAKDLRLLSLQLPPVFPEIGCRLELPEFKGHLIVIHRLPDP